MTPTIVSEMPAAPRRKGPAAALRVTPPNGAQTNTSYVGSATFDVSGNPPVPGKLRLVLGSPGGSTIITTVANDLISVIDNGLTIQQSADAPRFHHQYLPDVLQFEKAFPQDVVNVMQATGYKVERAGAKDENSPGNWGDSELIAVDPKTGKLQGGQDQRHHFGKAAGY